VKSLKDFVLETVQEACDLYGVSFPGGVNVKYREDMSASAFFTPMEQSITVNVRQCRTKRDVIFAIGHEVGHARQHKRLKGNMLFLYQMELALYGYNTAPIEIEADKVGFDFEGKKSYKNEVLYNDVPSVFISRKMARAGTF
jgi:hypothetical protein